MVLAYVLDLTATFIAASPTDNVVMAKAIVTLIVTARQAINAVMTIVVRSTDMHIIKQTVAILACK